MINFIATMKVKPDKEQDFIALVHQLTKETCEKEVGKGCLKYQWFKLREPNQYAVHESFENDAAEALHLNSEHVTNIAPPLIECLDGSYTRMYLDEFPE